MTDPRITDPYIFPEEEELLGILEDADVAEPVCDKAVMILRRVLEREALLAASPPVSPEPSRPTDTLTRREAVALLRMGVEKEAVPYSIGFSGVDFASAIAKLRLAARRAVASRFVGCDRIPDVKFW